MFGLFELPHDLAGEPPALRAAFRAAPLDGDRHRGRCRDAYRRGASASFRAQGPRSHAHDHRLTGRASWRPATVRSVGDLTSPRGVAASAGKPRSSACRSGRSSSTARICRSTPTWSSRRSSRAASLRAGATSSTCGSFPTVSISLSREHDWAPGTLSLSIQNFVALLRDMARDIVRALPARNLVIVNGHGGNRGVSGQSHPRAATAISRSMPASSIPSISPRSRRARRAPMSMAARARPR